MGPISQSDMVQYWDAAEAAIKDPKCGISKADVVADLSLMGYVAGVRNLLNQKKERRQGKLSQLSIYIFRSWK